MISANQPNTIRKTTKTRYRASGKTAYQLSDHLGNVRAVVMENEGQALSLTNRADYYPFEGSALRKCPEDIFSTEPVGAWAMPNRQTTDGDYRYAYQGQEKDKETNKEAFELRLWDARIGRWLTTDPYGEFASPYLGMGNNPISLIDPDGGQTGCPPGQICLDEYIGSGSRGGGSTSSGFMHQDFFNQFLQQQQNLSREFSEKIAKAHEEAQRKREGFSQFVNAFDYGSAAMIGTQIGMLEYRKTLPVNLKVGSFGQFARRYQGLGRGAAYTGYLGLGAGLVSNIDKAYTGEIGVGRFAYHSSTLLVSAELGVSVGGFHGFLAGLGVGVLATGAENIFDQTVAPMVQELYHHLGRFYETHIQNGYNQIRAQYGISPQ